MYIWPNTDVLISFGDVLSMSSGRNFAEWDSTHLGLI